MDRKVAKELVHIDTGCNGSGRSSSAAAMLTSKMTCSERLATR
jgi:hypothetical protein